MNKAELEKLVPDQIPLSKRYKHGVLNDFERQLERAFLRGHDKARVQMLENIEKQGRDETNNYAIHQTRSKF